MAKIILLINAFHFYLFFLKSFNEKNVIFRRAPFEITLYCIEIQIVYALPKWWRAPNAKWKRMRRMLIAAVLIEGNSFLHRRAAAFYSLVVYFLWVCAFISTWFATEFVMIGFRCWIWNFLNALLTIKTIGRSNEAASDRIQCEWHWQYWVLSIWRKSISCTFHGLSICLSKSGAIYGRTVHFMKYDVNKLDRQLGGWITLNKPITGRYASSSSERVGFSSA